MKKYYKFHFKIKSFFKEFFVQFHSFEESKSVSNLTFLNLVWD